MGITDILGLLGAIATFLFGISMMSDGLEKLSSGRLERILERLTGSVWKGVLLGAVVTAVLQSSSTTTVMCVGFVNAGIMKLSQAVGIIMGANIGTTVTAQILSLGDLTGGGFFLSLLKPSGLGPIFAVIGIVLYMFLKDERKKTIGQICLGFGLLFIGMNTMSSSVSTLKDMPQFAEAFLSFSNPVIGVLVGAGVTALIQSSSASVGILQALSTTGVVTFNIAAPLVMGQNIGTCITALISSVGASKNAKRTAMVHLFFNLIGSLVFLAILYTVQAIFDLSFWTDTMDMGAIANLHIVFNILCTVAFLPFHKQLVALAYKVVPGDGEEVETSILDERFLSSPSLALEKAVESTNQMGRYAHENYVLAVELLENYDAKKLERFHETEKALDRMEDKLDNYLVHLTDRDLSGEESATVSELFRVVSDFERMGDYAENLVENATYLHGRGLKLSGQANREMKALTDVVGKTLENTVTAYQSRRRDLAVHVEPLEEVVDLLCEDFRNLHVERLKNNKCTVELGSHFLELLFNLERISDHCSNVAMLIIRQTSEKEDLVRTDSHAYKKALHAGKDEDFTRLFEAYKAQYYTPVMQTAQP